MLKVRELREAKGLTQEGLAFAAGVGVRTITRIEAGNDEQTSSRTLSAIADALGVSVGDLFADSNGKRRKARAS